jgi:hypothetical protein
MYLFKKLPEKSTSCSQYSAVTFFVIIQLLCFLSSFWSLVIFLLISYLSLGWSGNEMEF